MIEAIIHVHNRVQYLERAVIAAVDSAALIGARVRISINATEPASRRIAEQVATRFGLELIYSQTVTAFEHFRASIESSQADQVCLLHDDDYVAPSFFKILQQMIENYPDAAAYAPNSDYMITSKLHRARISASSPFRLSPRCLAALYLVGRCGPSFPSIAYQRSFAQKAFAEAPVFGKYSDACIAIRATEVGLWVHPAQAFTYVFGTQNDSIIVDPIARRQLRRWLLQYVFKAACRGTHWLPNLRYFLGRVNIGKIQDFSPLDKE